MKAPEAADGPVEGLAGFVHRHAEVNDTRIHYVIGGDGPPVMLLHGFPYHWAVWITGQSGGTSCRASPQAASP